jgi:hypothetical protein
MLSEKDWKWNLEMVQYLFAFVEPYTCWLAGDWVYLIRMVTCYHLIVIVNE